MSIYKDEIILASDLLTKVEELEQMIESVEKKINKGYNIVYAISIVPNSNSTMMLSSIPEYDFVEIISYKNILSQTDTKTAGFMDVASPISTILSPSGAPSAVPYYSTSAGGTISTLLIAPNINSIEIGAASYIKNLNIICYKKEV